MSNVLLEEMRDVTEMVTGRGGFKLIAETHMHTAHRAYGYSQSIPSRTDERGVHAAKRAFQCVFLTHLLKNTSTQGIRLQPIHSQQD
jgi:hypothetical protein